MAITTDPTAGNATRRGFLHATSAVALASLSPRRSAAEATPAVHPGGSDEIRVALVG